MTQSRYTQEVNDERRPLETEYSGFRTAVDGSRLVPQALEHPLPAGLRDLLAEETFYRRSLARRILEHFALHGYDLVTPPAFELAEVLEKGLGTLDPGDVLRFVEPESGEVCALRPDMTPQIARMVATRLSHQPKPIRLCYEGTIVRRRQGRARRHRQVPQAGVELYGAPGLWGDKETLRLLASVSRSLGIKAFVIDLGHAGISRSLVDALPTCLAGEMTDALVHKDQARVEALLSTEEAACVPQRVARAMVALPDLSGGFSGRPGTEVLARASELFRETPAAEPLAEVRALWDTVCEYEGLDDLRDVLRIDLGEVRHFAYYTGVIFHAVAAGPGEPYASGGRYDALLERFGEPMAAVGFAMHLDAVSRARTTAGIVEERPARVLVAMHSNADAMVRRLRAGGIVSVEAMALDDAVRYAQAHGFTHVLQNADIGHVMVERISGPGSRILVGEDAILDCV